MKKPITTFRLAPLCLALGLTVFSSADAATRADFYAKFNPAAGEVPFPTNLLFSGSTDGTLNIPVADPANLADPRVAMNGLDGFSTVAPVTAYFSGTLNAATVQAGRTVRVFEVVLTNPFLDPKNPPFAVSEVKRELQAGVDYEVGLLPQDVNQTTLTISPLLPLAPKTGYLVVLTDGIQDSGGYNALPSQTYALTKLPVPLIDANGKSVIPGLSDAQAQALEPLRQLVNNQESAAASQGIAKANIVLSWTVMTQSIDDAFMALGKDLKPLGMGVKATGATTAALPSINLPGFSDIYVGALAIPYYLSKEKPTSGYWQTANGGAVTRYNPLPVATAPLQIPVLMTVPNAKAGQSKPATGWPVVIFQHGITQNRTNLFLLADALSFAGFAGVAIDLPLHGITDKTNPFYMAGLERTFDLDLVNNQTLLPPADGLIDPSGNFFINLQSLLTSRDNTREAAQDLRQLTATLPLMDLNGDGKPDLDAGHIRFVGHSLGGITGATFLGIEENITSATLGMAGGGIAKLLDGSATFGPRIAAGVAMAGIIKGTPAYESYLIGVQTVVDSGDPINYGPTAASLHPIHLIEVVGGAGSLPDQVVPNSVPGAPLAGTEPLAKVMGLQSANRSVWDDNGVRAIVRFTQGDHSSIISPVASVGATAEMQGQMIKFLQTEGTELEILWHPVIQ
ncbi:MAG: Ig-like domain-containing protein [Candidatus Contendobacter sp.]|nr:Ig-like domain-containing protein [Gammaproteobacteria bacterium]MCC8993692.1 Ig-like domain-containing protein [Candidatus Contendobacter sp.]